MFGLLCKSPHAWPDILYLLDYVFWIILDNPNLSKIIYHGVSICVQKKILSTRGVQPELGCSIVLVGCSVGYLEMDQSLSGLIVVKVILEPHFPIK